jgi:hypothetical protein
MRTQTRLPALLHHVQCYALAARLTCLLLTVALGGITVPARLACAQTSPSTTGAAGLSTPVPATRLKASLNRILEGQEFQPESREKSLLTQTIQRLRGYWERIRKWFQNLFRTGGLAAGSSVVTGILVSLLLAGLFWILFKIARDWSPRTVGQAAPNAILAEEEAQADIVRDPDVWAQQASEWAQKQDYRRAYRALFLALLLRLDAANVLSYDRARTNGDYLHVLRAREKRPLYDLLLPLARGFDRLWYGMEPARQSDYLALRETYDHLPTMLAGLAPSVATVVSEPAPPAGKAQIA